MSKTACLPVTAGSVTPAGTRLRSSDNVRRSSSVPRSAAVTGVRSGLVYAAASVATGRKEVSASRTASIYANEIETTLEMPREIRDSELAPLPQPARRPMTTRSLITPDVAASAAASAAAAPPAEVYAGTVATTTVEVIPAPVQVVPPQHRSLSPIKSAPVLSVQGFGVLTPAASVGTPTQQRSAAMREAFVAFGSFACVGVVAALLASGLLNFSASEVSAKEAAPVQVVTAARSAQNVPATVVKSATKTVTIPAAKIAPTSGTRPR